MILLVETFDMVSEQLHTISTRFPIVLKATYCTHCCFYPGLGE